MSNFKDEFKEKRSCPSSLQNINSSMLIATFTHLSYPWCMGFTGKASFSFSFSFFFLCLLSKYYDHTIFFCLDPSQKQNSPKSGNYWIYCQAMKTSDYWFEFWKKEMQNNYTNAYTNSSSLSPNFLYFFQCITLSPSKFSQQGHMWHRKLGCLCNNFPSSSLLCSLGFLACGSCRTLSTCGVPLLLGKQQAAISQESVYPF